MLETSRLRRLDLLRTPGTGRVSAERSEWESIKLANDVGAEMSQPMRVVGGKGRQGSDTSFGSERFRIMGLPLLCFSLPELTTTQQFMILLPETAAAPGAEVETDGNDLRTRLHCAWRLVTSAATLDLGFMHSLTPP
jgi:hypothetical protein